MMNRDASAVLNLTFDGGIKLFAETNAYFVSKIASDTGLAVLHLGCNGVLKTCTSINSLELSSASLKDRKDLVCRNCINGQNQTKADQKFYVEAFLSHTQAAWLEYIRIQFANGQSLEDILNMKYEDIEVVKLVFYDWCSLFKLQFLDEIEPSQVDRLLDAIHDFFCIYNSLHKICQISNIKYLLYTNGNYSLNTIARIVLKKYGINSFSIESQPFSNYLFNRATIFLERMRVANDGLCGVTNLVNPEAQDIKKILGVFRDRILGREYNAYTNLKKNNELNIELNNLRDFIRAHDKIHSYFAHSQDEVIPHFVTHGFQDHGEAKLDEFDNQEAFIHWLIDNVTKSPDVGFIVRLHPRMAPNKRQNMESNEHKRILDIINSRILPANLMFITGNSKISSYYLMLKSSLVIVGWSTVGIEALCMGRNVLSIFPKSCMYPVQYFSDQPDRQDLRKIILTGGVLQADFKKLGIWLANAYELQFFRIPVLRSFDGPLLLFISKVILILNQIPGFKLLFFSTFKVSIHQEKIRVMPRFKNIKQTETSLSDDQINKIFDNHINECSNLLLNYGVTK